MGSQTLLEFISNNQGTIKIGDDLAILVTHLQCACKRIAAINTSPFGSVIGMKIKAGSIKESGSDAPKPLNLVSNDIILSSLGSSGKVAIIASEEVEEPVWITNCGPFIVVTDPLDGSRNIDAFIPTGTIFEIYNKLAKLDHLPVQEKGQLNSLQSGTRLLVAGYVLHLSTTIMCISFGSRTLAFTLDRSTGEFVLTHPSIQIPPRDNQETLILNPLTGIPGSISSLIVDV